MICEKVVNLDSALVQYCIQTFSSFKNKYNENSIISNKQYEHLIIILILKKIY